MTGCEFCAIAAGEGDAAATLDAVDAVDESPRLSSANQKSSISGDVAATLREALDPDGFSAFYTSGPLVGSVDHAHVHLVPRSADNDVSLALDRGPSTTRLPPTLPNAPETSSRHRENDYPPNTRASSPVRAR